MKEFLEKVRQNEPLVHVITNFVTVNDCANIILASGGSPTMSHDVREVEEITAQCNSLVVNMGAIADEEAMVLAGKKAVSLSHPVILDPVAAGASKLRKEVCARLMDTIPFSVIRGNISEIKAIATGSASTHGVDAGKADLINNKNMYAAAEMAQKLSLRSKAVIVISGPQDIVTDGENVFIISNGCSTMARITGSGCMLSALLGAFCGANPTNLTGACIAAVCCMGVCGERAEEKMKAQKAGTASFRNYLIDAVSTITAGKLESAAQVQKFV